MTEPGIYQALQGMNSNLTVEIQQDMITLLPVLYNTFLPDILVYHAGWQADTPIVSDIHIPLPNNVRFHYNHISVPPASNSEKTAYTQSLPDIPQAHICLHFHPALPQALPHTLPDKSQ